MIPRWRPFPRRPAPGSLARVIILFVFVFIGPASRTVHSFGKGPYSHAVITRLALEEWRHRTGLELRGDCAEQIIQGSISSDNQELAEKDTYHCDNNNIAGCSYRLDQLRREARDAILAPEAFAKMGQALHIIQDFYSHSNWVERFQISGILAPLEAFKDWPPGRDLQTGYFPDVTLDPAAQVACYFAPPETWGGYIPFATHDCLNKDSDTTKRGIRLVPNTAAKNYHTLAAEYAVKHSADFLDRALQGNLHALACIQPAPIGGVGCFGEFRRLIEGL